MKTFDLAHIPLTGRNLVEASAGTGKTYSIAGLYLRLLVEEGVLPEQILVVTFTEAATQELRARVRDKIREALTAFEVGAAEDSFVNLLVTGGAGRVPDRDTALERLQRALLSFDLADISTIHGFALRMLQENAFESGSLYDTGLVTDSLSLLREVADDFWRTTFFGTGGEMLEYALSLKESPETLALFLRGKLHNPELRIIPSFTPEERRIREEGCRTAFREAVTLWRESREEIDEIVLGHPGLSRDKKFGDPAAALESFDRFAAGGNPFALFDRFGMLCASGIRQRTKKSGTTPEHPFFDRCEELQRGVAWRWTALLGELLDFARQRLPALKEERNVRTFDDLLTDLWGALTRPGGEGLAGRIRGRYRAILIDEFQDTDPVQYEIFRRICAAGDFPLFLIGDPKQAIYGFRGADVFAYLAAKEDVPGDGRFTMATNWRSSPELLRAFNTLFGGHGNPFVFTGIPYHPVAAGKKATFAVPGDQAPLQLWFVPRGEKKELAAVDGERILPAAVAGEIVRLLAAARGGEASVDGRPLRASDIAVIVRTHREGGLVQEALRRAGVHSVVRGTESLFASREAQELEALLAAVAEPSAEPRVRGALVSELLGRTGDDIARLLHDDAAWEEILGRFREYHSLWEERGFIVMFRLLLEREEVRQRLLSFPDGERRLTNLLHCGEVLHGAEQEGGGMERLRAWWNERIAAPPPGDEHQIRLESDDDGVKIVTVHVSKGLEYPVVFVPFCWGGVREDQDGASFHDGCTPVFDYGSPALERNRAEARREGLAENLRLLYVALTRARYRCYLAWGRFKTAETSAPAWLLHLPGDGGDDPVGALEAVMGGISDAAMLERLEQLAGKGEGSIAVTEIPLPETPPWLPPSTVAGTELACRTFKGRPDDGWRVASFTAFARGGSGGELPDRDATLPDEVEPAGPEEPVGIFAFPKGAVAGIFLHGIFEELDFATPEPEAIAALVTRGLARHGFDPGWRDPVCAMVRNVLDLPLAAPGGSFTLAGLAPGSWVPEFEFFFPLGFVTHESLGRVLAAAGEEHAAADLERVARSLRFRPVNGMVRGFMDMVFEKEGRYYLVDWKSNHLGSRVEDYAPARLKREMERNLYPLQYLLYTVALHRHLAVRLPGYDYDRHFGGVIYLFLRGIDPERGEAFGVFRDIPPRSLVESLAAHLSGGGAA